MGASHLGQSEVGRPHGSHSTQPSLQVLRITVQSSSSVGTGSYGPQLKTSEWECHQTSKVKLRPTVEFEIGDALPAHRAPESFPAVPSGNLDKCRDQGCEDYDCSCDRIDECSRSSKGGCLICDYEAEFSPRSHADGSLAGSLALS